MSDAPDSDPNPPDPSNEFGGEADDADLVVDIERLLDEASGAAHHLQEEIGKPGVPLTSDPAIDPLISEAPTIDVEAELAQVEAMLENVGQATVDASDDQQTSQPEDEFELPEAGYDPTGSQEAETTVGESADNVDQQPLAAHFDSVGPTAAEESIPAQTDDALQTPPKEEKGGPATTDQAPVQESQDSEASPQHEPGEELEPGEKTESGPIVQPPGWRARLIRVPERVVSAWGILCESTGPFLSRTVQVMLRVMDVTDRRLAWISYDVRKTLGWLAIALAVAAASMMIYSFS